MSPEDLINFAQWVFFAYFLGINFGYIGQNLIAVRGLRQYLQLANQPQAEGMFSNLDTPISVVVPAYNEAASITTSIRAMLQLHYPDYEVIVVNDGSTDDSLERLIEAFDLRPYPAAYRVQLETAEVRGVYRSPRYPNLRVIDKENGGSKSDALNAGINACRYPLVCVVDADSVLQPDSLARVARPFLQDSRTIAVGGTVRIANGCSLGGGFLEKVDLPRSFLAKLQVVEYLRAFLFGRMGWSPINALLIISGAFGVFRRDVMIDVGGFDREVIGEDMELILRMHEEMRRQGRPYRISFVPDPVCWTDAPEDLRTLRNQRIRWQHGLGESISRHLGLLFDRRGGAVSWLAMPFYLIFELFGPIIEVSGYVFFAVAWWQGWLSWSSAAVFLALAVGLGIVLSASAIMLEELSFHLYPRVRHVVTLYAIAVLENLGYRQLNAVWRAWGLFRWLLGRKGNWGHMVRTTSLADDAEKAAAAAERSPP